MPPPNLSSLSDEIARACGVTAVVILGANSEQSFASLRNVSGQDLLNMLVCLVKVFSEQQASLTAQAQSAEAAKAGALQ
jgi:hypothetical protein